MSALKTRTSTPPAPGDVAVKPDDLPTTTGDVLGAFKDSFKDDAPNYKKTQDVLNAFDNAPPRLAAWVRPPDGEVDPCAISPDAAYRGRENQLYRVEIHRPGLADGKPDGPTFKWSRENGAVTFRVLNVKTSAESGGSGRVDLTLESIGRDRRTGICVGDWIELVDWRREFEFAAEPLLQIEKIDLQRRTLTLIGTIGKIDMDHPVLARRWDNKLNDGGDGACLVKESSDDTGWIELERGIFVQFAPGGLYDTGQYWLIPARVVTGRVEWPEPDGKPASVMPHGVLHHRATLGIGKKVSGSWQFKSELTGYSHKPLDGLP